MSSGMACQRGIKMNIATRIRKHRTTPSTPDPCLAAAIVTETWHPYVDGIVTRLSHTVHELRSMGHKVMVVAPTGDPDFDGAEVVTVRTASLPFIYGGKRWGLPTRRVDAALDRFQPDVVHAVGPFMMGQ